MARRGLSPLTEIRGGVIGSRRESLRCANIVTTVIICRQRRFSRGRPGTKRSTGNQTLGREPNDPRPTSVAASHFTGRPSISGADHRSPLPHGLKQCDRVINRLDQVLTGYMVNVPLWQNSRTTASRRRDPPLTQFDFRFALFYGMIIGTV